MLATRASKSYFSESEAAETLGVSIEQFRSLVRTHIAHGEDEHQTDLPPGTEHYSGR